MRSFMRVLDVNLGFRPESAASFAHRPEFAIFHPGETNAYLDESLRRVRETPGVEAAGSPMAAIGPQSHLGVSRERTGL